MLYAQAAFESGHAPSTPARSTRCRGMNAFTATASMPGLFPSRLMRWLTCALIATGAAAASGGSGVQGTVTLSPTCGGPQREGVACSAPYADVELRLIASGGATVASTRTSPAGRYLLAAPAGRYRLQVMTPVKITRCPSPEVLVVAKETSVADIECDSGMR